MSDSFFRPRCQGVCALALLIVASVAQAQEPSRLQSPDPLDPQARVPAVDYRSPIENYRRLGEDQRVPWREANETVNRIGGWRAYAREAQQPETAAPATGKPASGGDPASRGHHSH